MVVTINTDASFYWEKQVGTYAMWIVSDAGTFKYHSAFKERIFDPTEAEYNCLINAIHILIRLKWDVTKLVINTDSLNCIYVIKKDHKACNKYNIYKKIKSRQYLIHRLIKQLGDNVVVDARHIRSHQHTNTKRNYVNQWCDDMARYEMDKLVGNRKPIH